MRDDVASALLGVAPGDEPGTLRAEFRFDPALAVFRGHFPGRPLVPGVFQIEMVRLAVERHTGRRYRIARVGNAKFKGEVAPGHVVALSARVTPRKQGLLVNADLRVGEAVKAKLAMVLGPSDAESGDRAAAEEQQKGGEHPEDR